MPQVELVYCILRNAKGRMNILMYAAPNYLTSSHGCPSIRSVNRMKSTMFLQFREYTAIGDW